MHQKVAHIPRLLFFLVFTVGVLLLSHTYLQGKKNSPQSAFYIDRTKTRLYGWAVDCYYFGPACLTNLCSFRSGFKNLFPYRKSGVKVVYMSSRFKKIFFRILRYTNQNFYHFLQFTVRKPELITIRSFFEQRSNKFFL